MRMVKIGLEGEPRMITIHGVLRSRASRNVWLLFEAGQAFRRTGVIQAYRLANPDAPDAPLHTRHPDFLRINPNGHVPTMVDGELVLHESLAINLYLAKKYGGDLGPRDLAEDGLMAMWALWAAAEAEPHTINILYHRVGKPPEEREESVAQAAIAALRGPFAALDAALAGKDWLVGNRFTVADINVAEVIRYAMPAAELFAAAPNVQRWLAACHARPAFKRMMAEREQEPA
jgi:glutathione S-transferase